MENGLSNVILKLYHTASGNSSYSPADVALEFAKIRIDEPLGHYSGISGKMPANRHILEDELDEENIDDLLEEM